MSHYFRLERSGGGLFVSLVGGVLNVACAAWHRDFARRAHDLGYRVTEGCDRSLTTCGDRFGNVANFRGEPHLPGNDLLTRYPGE